ncbi:MAG: inorganic phosphate transporter [Thermoplasmata archaeon]
MNYLIISASLFVLAAIVSGNNLSAGVGSLIGSNVTGRRFAILIATIGFTVGFLVGTERMSSTVHTLLPYGSLLVFLVIWGSVAIFIIAQLARVPISLTMAIVGIAVGVFVRRGDLSALSSVEKIALMWVIAPPIAIGISYTVSAMLIRRKVTRIWRTASLMKSLIIALGFFSSFTLGENTLGFIGALGDGGFVSYFFVVLGIVFGSLFLSGGVVRTLGYDMYSISYSNALSSMLSSSLLVEAATIFGIPLSNTQALTSGIIGAGLARRMRAVSLRPIVRITLLWFASPLVGIALGLII